MSDAFLKRGRLRARVWTAASAYLLCAVLFFLGLWSSITWLSVILFFLAAAALGAVNPPLDAARLDLTHPHVWGRSGVVAMVAGVIARITCRPELFVKTMAGAVLFSLLYVALFASLIWAQPDYIDRFWSHDGPCALRIGGVPLAEILFSRYPSP